MGAPMPEEQLETGRDTAQPVNNKSNGRNGANRFIADS